MDRWKVSPEKARGFQDRLSTLGLMHQRGWIGWAKLMVDKAMELVEPLAVAWQSRRQETIG